MTTIQELQNTLTAVQRHIEIVKGLTIAAIPACDENVVQVLLRSHKGSFFHLNYWVDNAGELHIETGKFNKDGTREEIYTFAKQYGWTADDVEYIKSGRRIKEGSKA